MIILSRSAFLQDRKKSIELMDGSVFIYPTDTLYGIGCDATKPELVSRVRQAKKSKDQPFSVIAPSKAWMKKNLEYRKEFDKWLDRLPGAYTLIMKIKNNDCISPETNAGKDTLGVRIPDNWFTTLVKRAGFPVITTSVNVTGSEPVTSLDQIPESIKNLVDFAIDDGVIRGRPSTLVDLTRSPPKMIKR
jgi:L-threonylcarbamoyladenylate synthase